MFELLRKYFSLSHSLGLPGIGTFSVLGISARTDFPNERMLAPSQAIHFDRSNDIPNKDLFHYLSRTQNISEWEAVKWVNDFSYEIKNQIRSGREVHWEGIGLLKSSLTGELILEPQMMDCNEFFPEVSARRVIRSGEQHAILVGDRERTTTEMSAFLEFLHPGRSKDMKSPLLWRYVLALVAVALIILSIHLSSGGGRSLNNQAGFQAEEPQSTYSTPQ